MLITLFKGTCGLGIAPGGWFCVNDNTTLGNSPFSSDDYYIFTFGYLLTAVMVMPLGFFGLVENILVQVSSFVILVGVLIQWAVAFCQQGLDKSLLPASGPNSSTVLGIVIFNYSYITTVSLIYIHRVTVTLTVTHIRYRLGLTTCVPMSISTIVSVYLLLFPLSCTSLSVKRFNDIF